jgi:hypothetical protein
MKYVNDNSGTLPSMELPVTGFAIRGWQGDRQKQTGHLTRLPYSKGVSETTGINR